MQLCQADCRRPDPYAIPRWLTLKLPHSGVQLADAALQGTVGGETAGGLSTVQSSVTMHDAEPMPQHSPQHSEAGRREHHRALPGTIYSFSEVSHLLLSFADMLTLPQLLQMTPSVTLSYSLPWCRTALQDDIMGQGPLCGPALSLQLASVGTLTSAASMTPSVSLRYSTPYCSISRASLSAQACTRAGPTLVGCTAQSRDYLTFLPHVSHRLSRGNPHSTCALCWLRKRRSRRAPAGSGQPKGR